jgi:eukaryotic-like serine/threonine-protein kinase
MESPQTTQKPVAEQESTKAQGRYEIQEELGRGATGAVYKAYDRLIGRTVALKAIAVDRNTPNREELIERLKLEAKAAGKLDHPNIITIYDVGQEDDVIYLSMQFIDGKTLFKYLAEDGVPPLPTFISWADQILTAVGFAHAHGVIHRDLKPANLMLTAQGTIKVLDFGVAKVGNDTMTQAGLVIGTPSYMAPEQVAGKKIDQRADIFALGSVFYELATREKPFQGDVTTILYKIMNEDPVPPSLINPALPGSLDAIIRQALAKDPKQRFQKCGAMRTALLQQAALLNIKPAAQPPAEKKIVAPAPTSNPFPHYLLEELQPRRSRNTRRGVLMVMALVLATAVSWIFYTPSYSHLLSQLCGTLESAVERITAKHFATAQSANKAAEQEPDSNTSDQLRQSGTGQNRGSDGKSLGDSPAVARAEPTSNDSSSTTRPQEQAVTQNPKIKSTDDAAAVNSASAPATFARDGIQNSGAEESPRSPEAMDGVRGNEPGPESAAATDSQTARAETAQDSNTEDRNRNYAAPLSSGTNAGKTVGSQATPAPDEFTRKDIPELVREADSAEERGDYRKALYKYELVLKLDPKNSAARAGLYRIKMTEQSH